ncbi:OadG family transporter subunit [Guggenheimella bovis]
MEQFANPEILKTMTLGEKLLDSLTVLGLGMGITFVVLVALIYAIKVLKIFSGTKSKPVEAKKVVESAPKKESATDEELVAVIAAAIASATGQSTSDFRIQSITRVSEPLPAWAQAGLMNNMKRL